MPALEKEVADAGPIRCGPQGQAPFFKLQPTSQATLGVDDPIGKGIDLSESPP
jgi:hypothetical protein